MPYTRTTDFMALLRDSGDDTGLRFERMPGLDWLVAGMAAAGMFTLWTHATQAPSTAQTTTVWLKTNTTSYAIEGAVYLWDSTQNAFVPATPKLWNRLYAAVGT